MSAVINPANGPGDSWIEDYDNGIIDLHDSGVEVLCYVATGFGHREVQTVLNDVDQYESLYTGMCDGVFLDEGPTVTTNISKYEEYYSYIQSVWPMSTVVVNPGITPDEAYYHIEDGTVGGQLIIVS
ncbi:unnamed protein product [Choristocarpus tenellus]